jgi:fatty-acyl-CoA synthase
VNIYPREVEDHLLGHPDVDDVAVIGVANDEFGEEVKAIVKLKPGVVGDDDLARSLREYCRAALAHYKCPRTVDFVDQLPRQANGKLYKRLLREQHRQAVTEHA